MQDLAPSPNNLAKSQSCQTDYYYRWGYIGVELAEAFATPQHQVTLIDGMPRILSKYLDPDFTNRIEKQFKDHGVTLALD